jgi:hypothetical protein
MSDEVTKTLMRVKYPKYKQVKASIIFSIDAKNPAAPRLHHSKY